MARAVVVVVATEPVLVPQEAIMVLVAVAVAVVQVVKEWAAQALRALLLLPIHLLWLQQASFLLLALPGSSRTIGTQVITVSRL
jgi:hypothetical protein